MPIRLAGVTIVYDTALDNVDATGLQKVVLKEAANGTRLSQRL